MLRCGCIGDAITPLRWVVWEAQIPSLLRVGEMESLRVMAMVDGLTTPLIQRAIVVMRVKTAAVRSGGWYNPICSHVITVQVQLLLEEYKMRVLLFQVRCKPLVMADEGSINHLAWRVVDRSCIVSALLD